MGIGKEARAQEEGIMPCRGRGVAGKKREGGEIICSEL
jgi:hypothetical protein